MKKIRFVKIIAMLLAVVMTVNYSCVIIVADENTVEESVESNEGFEDNADIEAFDSFEEIEEYENSEDEAGNIDSTEEPDNIEETAAPLEEENIETDVTEVILEADTSAEREAAAEAATAESQEVTEPTTAASQVIAEPDPEPTASDTSTIIPIPSDTDIPTASDIVDSIIGFIIPSMSGGGGVKTVNSDALSKEATEGTTASQEGVSEGTTEYVDYGTVYSNGVIYIYSYEQFLLIGTGNAVKDGDFEAVGTGNDVSDKDNKPVYYSLDGSYFLMGDIEVPMGEKPEFPTDFCGEINGGDESAKTRLYDKETDTIYIQNPYQMDIRLEDTAEEEPVMTEDYNAGHFGMGQLIYPDGEEGAYLTYSDSHKYIISAGFTGERPEIAGIAMIANNAFGNENYVDGRDYFGQASVRVGEKDYILIGCRQQLQAIKTKQQESDSLTSVYGPIYEVKQERDSALVGTPWNVASAKLIYPGDADLISGVYVNETETVDFSDKPLYDGNNGTTKEYKSITGGTDALKSRTIYVGAKLDEATGSITYDLDCTTDTAAKAAQNNLEYSTNGNYIIFRDISLRNEEWRPLTFNGTMYGDKAENSSDVGTLWDAGHTALNVDMSRKPVISDINVVPSTSTPLIGKKIRLEITDNTGVGFFSTIAGELDLTTLASAKTTVVSNIRLSGGTVENKAVTAHADTSLVSGLLGLVGGLLGGVLDLLVGVLTFGQVSLNLSDTLTSLLTAKEKEPSSLATGAFAGRITGDVLISGCEVDDITVNTVTTEFEDRDAVKIVGKGGFVGYCDGETQYDGLSTILGDLVEILANVLNIIPGIGLGDVITILLGNVLNVGELIPTGYKAPHIVDCSVNNVILSSDDAKVGEGGFAGCISGTKLENCKVTNSADKGMTINAIKHGGGFVGVARDGIIGGTLTGLGIDVLAALQPQSELIGCSIDGGSIAVVGGRSEKDSCLGGFAGTLANSYIIDGTIDLAEGKGVTVNGLGNNVGGLVGHGALGTAIALGGEYGSDDSDNVLGAVTGLVTGLLGTGTGQALLSLGGASPSGIMGCVVESPISVNTDGSFAGGIIGRGDGTLITSSSSENIVKLSKYKKYDNKDGTVVEGEGDASTDITVEAGSAQNELPTTQNRPNKLSNITSVKAGGNCAGGIAGILNTADAGGLLDSTLGLVSYLPFEVSDTTVSSKNGYTVEASDFAGGGIGAAMGGVINNANVQELKSVTAKNRAGGFVGCTEPGSVASSGGLNLTLLGLDILSVDNLLNVADNIDTIFTNSNVTGINSGYSVEATGTNADGEVIDYVAGGYAARVSSVKITDCHAYNLGYVKANNTDGIAGGFVGLSNTGGLLSAAEAAEAGIGKDDGSGNLNLINISDLLGAVPYLVPSYVHSDVTYVDGGYIEADSAGGYAGDFQSGKVNCDGENEDGTQWIYTQRYQPSGFSEGDIRYNSDISEGELHKYFSVYNIGYVKGRTYAGGFGGKVYSGALADAGGGLSLLGGTVQIGDLLSVAEAYVPIVKYAGVCSKNGFYVIATGKENASDGTGEAVSGHAGGYIGYGSGVQISYCDVNMLKNGKVTAPIPLEGKGGDSYLSGISDNNTPYGVSATKYAGGYIGHMDIGSAASLGGGLDLLGENISLTGLLDALSVVVSTIEHSNVYGAGGGFSVLASKAVDGVSGGYGTEGMSGGFAGLVDGGHIQDSNVENFNYIVGETAAGGYIGEAKPGDVASVLGEGNVLKKLVNIDGLLSLFQDFVPTVRNSRTACIPCGGGVRAQTPSDEQYVRGMAGGYIGHAQGVQIWGESRDTWKTATKEYDGPTRYCDAIRIRSVYGAEYAGGYVGLTECASTAQGGSLSLLGGAISLNNIADALKAVYPTIKKGRVYGPLDNLDLNTWNSWVEYVGKYGGFASELAKEGTISTQAQLNEILKKYTYGYNAVAGRDVYDNLADSGLGGCAGGFAGSMHSGIIENCGGINAKNIKAMRAAGGFAGEMQTSGLAEFGNAGILGLNLNIGNILQLAQVFVPSIKNSDIEGYSKGINVEAFGDKAVEYMDVGNSGGYVGGDYGGQIEGCDALSVYKVSGVRNVGGYAGRSAAGSVVNVNTTKASDGLLQQILNSLLSTPNELVQVLQATRATIKDAKVTAYDNKYGLIVDGTYKIDGDNRLHYADNAGGFIGEAESTLIGENSENSGANTLVAVEGLRGVKGGDYAGGFVGLAQTGSVAEVSGTNILQTLNLGDTTVLDAFRTYIYNADVKGAKGGIQVFAEDAKYSGLMNSFKFSGAAGGFGGGVLNGSVHNSTVSELNLVEAPMYAAGFIGYMGKSGGVGTDAKVENDSVLGKIISGLGLDLGAAVQALNLVGTTVKGCGVTGISAGFDVKTTAVMEPITDVVNEDQMSGAIAAGFAAMADVSKIEGCSVKGLKRVSSGQLAGGFIGKSTMDYLINADASSKLTELLVRIINPILNILYGGLSATIPLSINILGLIELNLAREGDLLSVNLLGLKISVGLEKSEDGTQDKAIVWIGDSYVELACTESGGISKVDGAYPNLAVHLIKGNRTTVDGCSVTGIEKGYDVFGGGADQNTNGEGAFGCAGGFVARNDEGKFTDNTMTLCDVVRGSAPTDKHYMVGPFSGWSSLDTQYPNINNMDKIEGVGNKYYIYRTYDKSLAQADTSDGTEFQSAYGSYKAFNNVYEVAHYSVIKSFGDLLNAYASARDTSTAQLDVYLENGAKALLMNDAAVNENSLIQSFEQDELIDPCDETFSININKKWELVEGNTAPDSITVKIYRTEAGESPPYFLIDAGQPKGEAELVATVTLSAEDKKSWSDEWSKQVPDLPIAKTVGSGDTATVIYYKYYVAEDTIAGFDTTYKLVDDTASVNITNRDKTLPASDPDPRDGGELMPFMGGAGTRAVTMAGILLLVLGACLMYIKKCRKEDQG